LAAQEKAIRAECQRRGWTLLDVARDEGHSGKSLDRPALHQALQRIAAGEAGGLVVAKLDRASRSVVDFGRLLEWFDAADATLVALDLGMDTSTSSGRLVANVMASVAEWERSVIGERTRDALAARKAQGLPISRPAVTGPLAETIRELRAAARPTRRSPTRSTPNRSPPCAAPRNGASPPSRAPPATNAARRPRPARSPHAAQTTTPHTSRGGSLQAPPRGHACRRPRRLSGH
jgi:DNA invertase Pin-like site-specific DNA recombinase